MTHKKTLACLVGLLTLQNAHANEFSNTLFFGDSLTDSGSFLPILQANPSYNGAGKFTTNPGPVWSEVLAAEYGVALSPANQGGTNYAEGGARIIDQPGVGSFPATGATPILTQVQSYLAANGGKADPNALYSLWGGANDIFWIAGGQVATADISNYLTTTITGQVQAIGALRAAGAKYIIVPTLPDIGASPFGTSQDAAGAEGLTRLSKTYNDNLMQALRVNNISVITADMFTLLKEIQSQPNQYGFENVSLPVCGALSSLLCVEGEHFPSGLEQTFLFADGVHPTSSAHKIISEYVKSILDAPAFAQSLLVSASLDQLAIIDEIDTQLNQSRMQNDGETSLWISGSMGNQDGVVEASPTSLGIGLSVRQNQHQTLGAGLHLSQADADMQGGNVDASTTSFTVYGGWDINQWQLNSSLTVSAGDYDTQRTVNLGAATRTVKGSTDGIHFGAQASLHYPLETAAFHHGPTLRLRYQRLSLSGFSEEVGTGSSTAMHFGAQTDDRLTAVAGWQIRSKGTQWQPYGGLEWEQILTEDPDSVTASLVNLPGNVFSLPTIEQDKGTGKLTLGVDGKLTQNMSLSARITHAFANDSRDDTRFNLSANIRF